MGLILALDLGTTGNRAVVYDNKWQVVASAYCAFEQYFPQNGWVEHDPVEIWQTTHQVLTEVLSKIDTAKLVGMGITNQRETVVMWDSKTGKPLYNAIVWQCRRTADRCAELGSHQAWIKEKTGLPLDPYFSATKVEWLLAHVPNARQMATLKVGTVDSWILWNLTGGNVHATDTSNASRTMLCNLKTGQYDPELLALFGIPEAILPVIMPSDSRFGMTDPAVVGVSVPIHAILGDQQASLFAQCGSQSGTFKNTYGTGLFVVMPTEKPVLSDRLVTTIAWNQGGKLAYALEGSVFVGGSVVQWLRDACGWITTSAESEALALSVPDSNGVVMVPALTGLGAPYWDAAARGALFGLTRGTLPAHMVRAALESLAFQTADVVAEFRALFPELTFSVLRVDGGAASNDFLMQFQADCLNIKVERPVHLESTALGVAAFAAISLGVTQESEFRFYTGVERVFEPAMQDNVRDKLLERWHQAVKACRQF